MSRREFIESVSRFCDRKEAATMQTTIPTKSLKNTAANSLASLPKITDLMQT